MIKLLLAHLFENSGILDIETTGLHRGAGIHSLAYLNEREKLLHSRTFKPSTTRITKGIKQDHTGLATGSADIYEHRVFNTWDEVIDAEAQDLGGSTSARAWTHRWLTEQLQAGKYKHMRGLPHVATQVPGFTTVVKADQDIRNFVTEDLRKLMSGQTVWIANANFENKQIGAILGAIETQGGTPDLKTGLETYGKSVDPFYVTGYEVNRARTKASITGDWRPVWSAIKRGAPPPGAIAVRDILDVTKSLHSYGQHLGLYKTNSIYHGTSIDVSKRLMGFLQVDDADQLLVGESHIAELDVLDERQVRNRAAYYTEVLSQVQERTELGQQFVEQDKQGQGPLARVKRYFAAQEFLSKELEEKAAVERIARAGTDLINQGDSVQTDGYQKTRWVTQQLYEGGETKLPIAGSKRVVYDELTDVITHLSQKGQYGSTDLQALAQEVQPLIESRDIQGIDQWASQRTSGVVDQAFHRLHEHLGGGKKLDVSDLNIGGSAVLPQGVQRAKTMVQALGTPVGSISPGVSRAGAVAGVGAGLLMGWGILSSATAKPQERPPSSLFAYNYDQWLERQDQMFGLGGGPTMEGMRGEGIAGGARHQTTDFGSPYRGPVGSSLVFADQELREERERWQRQQFGARHFDPEFGLFGRNSVFSRFKINPGGSGYSFFQGGSRLPDGEYAGLNKKGLHSVTIGQGYKLEVEDADTVVVKRGGIRGAVSSFFGMNKGHSFRLVGIDSAETSHGEGSYRSPQPYAEEATRVLKQMVSEAKNLEVVFDPGETTYGRMVGAIVADGQNLNYELVKRGAAAHLPYGKASNAMIDYRALASLEATAAASRKGMWGEPYHQAFYQFSEASGHGLTLNTLARKSRIAESSILMSVSSIMEDAKARGSVSPEALQEMTRLGRDYKDRIRNKGDESGRHFMHRPSSPANTYHREQLADLQTFTQTKGTGANPNKVRSRNGLRKLDSSMALDTMGNTTSIWNKRRLQSFEQHGVEARSKIERKQRMMELQRRINQEFGTSPIGHHRM